MASKRNSEGYFDPTAYEALSKIEREAKAHAFRPMVYICSPLSGNIAANQRNEVRDLHDVAGALSTQPGMKQQTFIAQDCLTPWDTQQARIFTPESKAPTLASADGGG